MSLVSPIVSSVYAMTDGLTFITVKVDEIIDTVARYASSFFSSQESNRFDNINPNTALSLAVDEGDVERCKELLKEPNEATSVSNLPLWVKLKMKWPHSYKSLKGSLSPEIRAQTKAVVDTKTLGHAFHLSGKSRLPSPQHKAEKKPTLFEGWCRSTAIAEDSYEMEGSFGAKHFARVMASQMTDFSEAFPEILPPDRASRLRSVLEFHARNPSAEEVKQRFDSGLATLIETGYCTHSVEVLLWKVKDRGLFVLCNRGEASRAPIEVYLFDPNNLNISTIYHLLRLQNQDRSEYQKMLFDYLPFLLRWHTTAWTEAMARCCTLPDQTVDNCTWASLEMAIYALFFLGGWMQGDKGRLDETAAQLEDASSLALEQNKIFQRWLDFTQDHVLSSYLKALESPNREFYDLLVTQ